MAKLSKFYFTYGASEEYPFEGGWTEVIAENEAQARNLFRTVHPDRCGCLNCAFVYTEDEFKTTRMYQKQSNLGAGCHETISIDRKEN